MKRSQAKAAAARLASLTPDAAFVAGLALLKEDFPELLLSPARHLADRHRSDPRMAQLLGLTTRAVGDGPQTLAAFRRAATLAPGDALIAHSHARAALEAGHPAVALFEAAQQLAPNDGSVIQGLAAALVAEGAVRHAEGLLERMLQSNPLWLDGHRTLAQIRGQYGGAVTKSLEDALALLPANPDLHRARIATLLSSRRLAEVPAAVSAAESELGMHDWLLWYRAHASSELGMLSEADHAFGSAPEPSSAPDLALLVRHEIRSDRAEHAARLMKPWIGARDPGGALWPYAALAWRLTGDPRSHWLDGDDSLIGIYDLADRIGDLPGLTALLRTLHTARVSPLDQSVRGGTQTDGNLLLRNNPHLQALRRTLVEAVAEHVARLSKSRPGHPTLIARRQPRRIAGSWSVRLQGAGFHADHVHPHGWLSSALYIALPDRTSAAGDVHAGWLSIGECRELLPGLAPQRLVEPKPGRLVLFPSTMWHGTRPFSAGERLTIALDIARPKQD